MSKKTKKNEVVAAARVGGKVKKEGNLTIRRFDDTPRNRRFEELCVKTQEELKSWLKSYLAGIGKEVIEGDGWLFVDGSTPVLLTAHMDTVHAEKPKEIVYENGTISSPQGIGGDDRCGVYAIIEILKEIDCPALFCEDEEIGGIGSNKFTATDLCEDLGKRIHFVIDIDRANHNDAVYYEQANTKFERFVEAEFWKQSWGSFTDICHLCPALEVSGVNLSCGYYKQHTLNEYVVLEELEKAIRETKKLIRRAGEERYEYIEDTYSRWDSFYGKYSYGSYGSYKSFKDEFFYVSYLGNSGEEVEFIQASNEIEALGQFFMDHPTLTYNDVISYGYEDDYDYDFGYDKDFSALIHG